MEDSREPFVMVWSGCFFVGVIGAEEEGSEETLAKYWECALRPTE